MAIIQFLPARFKVALRSARNDTRSLVRAFRAPRTKGIQSRNGAARFNDIEVRFVPARSTAPQREAHPETAAVIVFADSGVTVDVGPDETILEAGIRNGVDLLFSCTLGGCGACMLHVSEGVVEYDEPDAICLTEDEIEDGCCLACVGKPRGKVVVEA